MSVRTKILAYALVASVAVAGGFFVFPYPQLSSAIAQGDAYYWCGLFVHSRQGFVANLAVHLSSTQLVYATDTSGYTRIYNSGFTDGCPGQVNGTGVDAWVFFNNTEYAAYLWANHNVTLEVR